ncbi:MAG: hypothetical protein WCO63_00750 [Bacteroidota bacterium]
MIFIFLCVPYSIRAEDAQRKADSLYRAGAYYEASLEYERSYFLASDPAQRCLALLEKAECLKQIGEYSKAAARLREVPHFGVSDSLFSRLAYQIALCDYLAGDFQAARAALTENDLSFINKGDSQNACLLKVLIWNELHQYDSAQLTAIQYVRNTISNAEEAAKYETSLNYLYKPRRIPKIRNAESAVWMSRFIPGLGQTWLGYPGEGSISFLLNASALGLGIYGIISGYPITGYFLGASFLQKFYFGGLNRTEYLAGRRNYAVTKAFNDSVRKGLSIK